MWIFYLMVFVSPALKVKDFLLAIVEDGQITLVLAGDGCLVNLPLFHASDTP